MGINVSNNGSEVIATTAKGNYTAYGPLDPKNKNGFDVKTPAGEVVKMQLGEFMKILAENAPVLERNPAQDTFQKTA